MPYLDVREQPHITAVDDLDQDIDDALDPWMIGCDAVADKAEGRLAVKEVDAQIEIAFRLRSRDRRRLDPAGRRRPMATGRVESFSHLSIQSQRVYRQCG